MWHWTGISLLLMLLVLHGAYWSLAWYRANRSRRSAVSVREGMTLPAPEGGWPRVSIVIPAHDEERMIRACAASLAAQSYANLEVVFVLDRCSDGTKDLLEPIVEAHANMRIVEIDSCPEDWAGKTNAMRIGAEATSGRWILFADADTQFDADLARAAVALAEHRSLDMLSVLSSLRHEHRFERIAQPVAAMCLLTLFPVERTNRSVRPRPFANGQFILIKREAYQSYGGHEAVKSDIVEDIAMARHVHRQGGRGGLVLAGGMLRCSMYETLEQFHDGWKRILCGAFGRRASKLRRYAFGALARGIGGPLLMIAAVATATTLAAGGATVAPALLLGFVAANLIAQYAALRCVYRLCGAPLGALLLYPVGCWIVSRLLLEGAADLRHRRPVAWAGRTYVLEAQ